MHDLVRCVDTGIGSSGADDSERLAVLQEIERQTIEQERKVSKVSRIISQYERLKRNLR